MANNPPPTRITQTFLDAFHGAQWSSGHITIAGVSYWLTISQAGEWTLTTSEAKTIAYGDAYLLHDAGSRANADGTFQVSGGAVLALLDAVTSAAVAEW